MKHEWFYFKQDAFRSCKKCGGIENPKITKADNCPGKAQITLRKHAR